MICRHCGEPVELKGRWYAHVLEPGLYQYRCQHAIDGIITADVDGILEEEKHAFLSEEAE